MPVATFEDLEMPAGLVGAAGRLKSLEPGVLLAAGQTRSGKVTTLAAIAASFAEDGRPVEVLSDRAEAVRALEPFPSGWKTVAVEPSSEAWSRELAKPRPAEGIVLVATLAGKAPPHRSRRRAARGSSPPSIRRSSART
jgi:hypothetical protein